LRAADGQRSGGFPATAAHRADEIEARTRRDECHAGDENGCRRQSRARAQVRLEVARAELAAGRKGDRRRRVIGLAPPKRLTAPSRPKTLYMSVHSIFDLDFILQTTVYSDKCYTSRDLAAQKPMKKKNTFDFFFTTLFDYKKV
jgi:hypothetical protein